MICTVTLFNCHDFALADDFVRTTGDVGRYVIPAVAVIVPIIERDYPGFGQAVVSILAVEVVTEALKYAVQEPRPDMGSKLSFPSGHTSVAFSGAAFIHRRYGFRYSIPLYGFASFVAYSRLSTSSEHPHPAHHLQDVLVGGALGIVIPWIITKPRSDKITIEPQISSHYAGLKLSTSW